ncbi:helix-turn-helix domain-containing protein [Cetobacterium sp.]|uniref:helix-turn-helix domain-containing protein n=1 Tax=Cetobacterium sp. TaxID=2071632 RepID=UPI002FC70FA6
MYILNLIENSFNCERLKKMRIKRNLSLTEVAEKMGTSEATLSRYENGLTKKIPIKTVKKLAEIYDVSYTYFYGLTSIPLATTLIGVIVSFLNGVSLDNIYIGSQIGGLIGFSSYGVLKKYFEKNKDLNPKESLYKELTEDEKEEYEAFKSMNHSFLKTKQVFSKDEMEESEAFLLSYYFAHKVKREAKIIDADVEFNKK